MQIFCRVMKMSWTRPGAMKLTSVKWPIFRILVVPKDPVQANPLKGWNNAYHGTSKYGVIYPTGAHVTDEGARVSNLGNNRNRRG